MLLAKAVKPKQASFLAGIPTYQAHPSAVKAPVPEDTRVPVEESVPLLHHSALTCHWNSTSLLKILTALKMQISLG